MKFSNKLHKDTCSAFRLIEELENKYQKLSLCNLFDNVRFF